MSTVQIVRVMPTVTVNRSQTTVLVGGNKTTVVATRTGGPGAKGDPGDAGASAARERRYSTVDDSGTLYSYIGIAAIGSLDSEAVWTIRKLQYNSEGEVVVSLTAAASPEATWDNRLTEDYS